MEKNSILVIDDDRNILAIIEMYLRKAGYEVTCVERGDEALQAFRRAQPALVVLDVMLPGMDGWEVLDKLRQESDVPVIMLTAKGDTLDRIQGLDLGADDYIVKPFSPREVLARIRAVLRRFSEPAAADESVVRFPQLEINLSNYQVKACGQVIPCTPKEVEILHMLTSSAGQVFTREQILSRVWGYDYFGDTRTVDTHIKRIRQKLPQEGVPWGLKTVYGVGYKFEVEQ